jgi:hypothetical protein
LPLCPQAIDAAVAAALSRADAADEDVPQSADAVVAAARSGDATPLCVFRDAYLDALRYGDHEAVDHPVACLLVQASTLAGDPVRAFTEQFRGGNMPSILRAGAADPLLLRHHIILHDASSPRASAASAEAIRAELAVTFGPSAVTVLAVNSRGAGSDAAAAAAAAAPPLPDIWTPARSARRAASAAAAAAAASPQAPPAPPGACLSAADVARVAGFVDDFATKLLIPFMESKVVSLSAAIAATRKGLRNTLKSLWKGKEPRAVELPPDGAYHHATPEAQLRLCADLALALRDYELAAGHLRLAAADFRADRAARQAGGAAEALGAALAAAEAPRRDVDAAFDAAWAGYRGAPPPRGPQLAVRAALVQSLLPPPPGGSSSSSSSSHDSTAALTRASYDAPDGVAAALLEAAAAAHARAAPPRLRKAAFHGVLAGHRYTLAGARAAAVRAYAHALPLLAGKRWRFSEAHVRFALARHLAHAGAMPAAATHFAALLGAAPGAPSSHASYLREFAYVADACAAADTPLPPLALLAPGVDTRRVRVASEDHRGYGGAAARMVGEEAWAALEASLVPSELAIAPSGAGGGNWLEGAEAAAARGAAAAAAQACACCAGEAVCVDVAMSNPLTVPLDIAALRLEATFTHADAAAAAPSEAAAAEAEANGGSAAAAAAAQLEEQSLSLQPGERVVVRLRVTPPGPGELLVTGVTWRLGTGGAVPGRAPFDVAAPRRRRASVAAGGGWQRDVPPASRLLFRVGPPAPRLAASLEGLPEAVPAGALVRATLRLSNDGVAPLSRLRLAASTPLLLAGCAPLPYVADASSDASLSACDAAACLPLHADSRAWPVPFEFPLPHASLAPGERMDWPIWLHAAEAGPLESFQISIFYTPLAADGSSSGGSGSGAGSSTMRYRVLRLCASLAVRPSLRADAAATASDAATSRRLVQLSVAATQPYRSFTLLRVGASDVTATAPPPRAASASATSPFGSDAGAAAALPHAPPRRCRLRGVGGAAGAPPGGVLHPGAACALVLAIDAVDSASSGGGAEHASSSSQSDDDAATHVDLCDASSAPPPGLRPPPPVVAAFLARAAAGAAAPGARAALLVPLEWWSPAAPGAPAVAGLHVLRPPPAAHAHTHAPATHAAAPHAPPALRACLRGAADVAHDFRNGPALLSLHVDIRNDSGAHAAHPRLELLPPGDAGVCWTSVESSGAGVLSPASGAAAAAAATRGVRCESRVTWCGVTRATLPTLPPGGAISVPITALAAAPGVADMRRWRLSWRLEGEVVASPDALIAPPGVGAWDGTPLLPHAQAHNPPFLVAVRDVRAA